MTRWVIREEDDSSTGAEVIMIGLVIIFLWLIAILFAGMVAVCLLVSLVFVIGVHFKTLSECGVRNIKSLVSMDCVHCKDKASEMWFNMQNSDKWYSKIFYFLITAFVIFPGYIFLFVFIAIHLLLTPIFILLGAKKQPEEIDC